ncbi:MAG: DUF1684 domain-containing protein [Acidimicrobiia bacterium]|nr:DUF1684 domain-containing protein [Acidimicrobiia bacterium]MDH3470292.1 DUF1684 domain-containing protein [Acidimicrobiia bacterium]
MDALAQHRADKDDYFKQSHDSPIPHEDRHDFSGLNYYDADPDLVLDLVVKESDGAELTIDTTDEQQRVYRRAATVEFEAGGQQNSLALYDTGHAGYFVPFRDETSGKDTYGAGRYLDVEPNDDGTVTIDFNYAYNPLCVYNDAYSCPLPPAENWLQIPIEAGEKSYSH